MAAYDDEEIGILLLMPPASADDVGVTKVNPLLLLVKIPAPPLIPREDELLRAEDRLVLLGSDNADGGNGIDAASDVDVGRPAAAAASAAYELKSRRDEAAAAAEEVGGGGVAAAIRAAAVIGSILARAEAVTGSSPAKPPLLLLLPPRLVVLPAPDIAAAAA